MRYKVDALYVRDLVASKIEQTDGAVGDLWAKFRNDLDDWEERKDEFLLEYQLELEKWASKPRLLQKLVGRPKIKGNAYEVYGMLPGSIVKRVELERDASSYPGNRREVIELRMLRKIKGYLDQVDEGYLLLTMNELRYFDIDFSRVIGVVREGR